MLHCGIPQQWVRLLIMQLGTEPWPLNSTIHRTVMPKTLLFLCWYFTAIKIIEYPLVKPSNSGMRYILLRHQLPMLPGIRLIDTYISPMRATGLLGAVMPRFGIKFSGIFWMCTYTAVLRNCQQNLDKFYTRRVWPPVGSNGSISSGPLLATDPTAGSTGYISHWVATS